MNFHGEPSARIEYGLSIYDDKHMNRTTLLIKALSLILFSAPEGHLRHLQKIWTDGEMHNSGWEDRVKRLKEEWQEFVFFVSPQTAPLSLNLLEPPHVPLQATVVLNANVAFLAIQSVDLDINPYRSPAQISSYLSIVANIGSIIIGLFLKRQYNANSSQNTNNYSFVSVFRLNLPLLH